jgi:hypothetical protein
MHHKIRFAVLILIGAMQQSCAPPGYKYEVGSFTPTLINPSPLPTVTPPVLLNPAVTIQPAPIKQLTPSVIPIEPKAILFADGKEDIALIQKLADFVQTNDYRCDSVSSWRPMFRPRAFVLGCNKGIYTYDIEDKGGHWIITVE